MLDETTEGPATPTESGAGETTAKAKKAPAKRRTTAKKAAGDKTAKAADSKKKATDSKPADSAPAESKPKAAKAKAPKKAGKAEQPAPEGGSEKPAAKAPAKKAPAKKAPAKKKPAKSAAQAADAPAAAPAVVFQAPGEAEASQQAPAKRRRTRKPADSGDEASAGGDEAAEKARAKTPEKSEAKSGSKSQAKSAGKAQEKPRKKSEKQPAGAPGGEGAEDPEDSGSTSSSRRRRRRGGRRRRKTSTGEDQATEAATEEESGGKTKGADESAAASAAQEGGSSSSRRRRRRRRSGDSATDGGDDPENTVTKVRSRRSAEDQIQSVTGSTRLEAKKQRRREGREAGRRRAPIVSEAEFLARRESVERTMVVREAADLTQIAVLEDKILVEHYVARESQTSLIGNVYLGRVQNVLPSMEAAFIDIGKGRNAVLYAGEVNWQALGHKDGEPRKIESVLKSGQGVLVQVTKDPIGHKGARLTSQISLAGRFLVYVPDGTTSGISRKLPDTERNRLKTLLKQIVPESAGVIVRTAAEGAAEEELTRDVERLKARWEDIEKKAKGTAPRLLYGEPDLTLKVVRDLFTEDFAKLVIQGDEVWETVRTYVEHVAPDLVDRLEKFELDPDKPDVFAVHRIDEQIHKALDRKVWLPSGGSLIFDRTEAMTVVDVNTGKFTGSGGNLEETVTKNNLESAEEIVRQLRLRDIGGIIVIDFIDMVLESNRDLVLRRLVECLSRDRTRHQVAEVTSLGLVQMTRKRIGTGLLEAFSHTCEACSGRGLLFADEPVEARRGEDESRRSRRTRTNGNRSGNGSGSGRSGARTPTPEAKAPSPRDVAAMARPEPVAEPAIEPAAAAASEPAAVVEAEAGGAEVEAPPTSDRKSTASRRSRSKQTSRAEKAAAPAAPTAVADDVPESAAEPADAPGSSTPDVAPEADTAPVETAAAAPADKAAPEVATESAPEPAPGPTTRVVTRTRRRGASRPAGRPVSAASEAAGESVVPAPAATANGSEVAEQPGTTTVTLHVPVKKRGSRKR